MNEKEIDAEVLRLKDYKRVKEKEARLKKLKDEVNPTLSTRIFKILSKIGDKL